MSYEPHRWKNAYSVDFTSLSSQNIRTGGNGTKTIDSHSWTWANDANCTSADVVNGTGIVVAASNTNTSNSNANRTGPNLSVLATELFPAYSVLTHILRLQVRVILTNSVTNFEYGGIAIEYTTTPTTQRIHLIKGFQTSANRLQTESTLSGTTTVIGLTSSISDDVFCMIFDAPARYETRSGAFTSTPMNAETYRASEQQAAVGSINTPAKLQFALLQSTLNTVGGTDGFSVTYTHLQLDYTERVPSF